MGGIGEIGGYLFGKPMGKQKNGDAVTDQQKTFP